MWHNVAGWHGAQVEQDWIAMFADYNDDPDLVRLSKIEGCWTTLNVLEHAIKRYGIVSALTLVCATSPAALCLACTCVWRPQSQGCPCGRAVGVGEGEAARTGVWSVEQASPPRVAPTQAWLTVCPYH